MVRIRYQWLKTHKPWTRPSPLAVIDEALDVAPIINHTLWLCQQFAIENGPVEIVNLPS